MKASAIPGGPSRAPWLSGEPSHVLIALCGYSPAVITETVWALAHEEPPVLPARVVAVTTRAGRETIRRELLDSGVWERLRRVLRAGPDRLLFGDSADAVRIIPNASRDAELEDIRAGDDTLAVADFLLETLRQFTEDPSVRIVLSIAGGRKTMSVAAALALTLLGRSGDRMCHVLAAPPFDRPDLEPRFYFPDPAVPEYTWSGPDAGRRVYAPARARIVLADIPYVRVRYLLSARYGPTAPVGYRKMVDAALACSDAVAPPVLLRLAPRSQAACVSGIQVFFSPAPYGLLLFLAARARWDCPPLTTAKTLQAELGRFLERLEGAVRTPFAGEAKRRIASAGEPDYARKLVHSVETRLAALDLAGPVRKRLRLRLPDRRGHYALTLRPEEVDVSDLAAELVRDRP
ncbi:MAG: TIGR02584 family CRISPR-associated protein [Kiritimatiellaeota bacterium]|nr:TIGR02584 family CRISPR-associated protein [Kiritimatiellota bacterium]